MSTPTLSVIMPVYNGGRYLARSLASIIAQEYGDFECIVVNDGSTDGTRTVLDRFCKMDSRVRVIERENRGLVASLNEAIEVSSGRYLGRMDGDDWCEPKRFAKQVSYLERYLDVVAIGTFVHIVDPSGRRLKTYQPPQEHSAIVAELLSGNGGAMIHPAVTMRAEAVRMVGGYDPEMSAYGEDWDLFLRLSQVGRLCNLPETLLSYRQHWSSYNVTRGEVEIRRLNERVDAARLANGMPLLMLPAVRKDAEPPSRRWALWALEGREMLTALRHSLTDVVSSPRDRRAWSLFAYICKQLAQDCLHLDRLTPSRTSA